MSRGTRQRAATHSSGLLSEVRCPFCACRHVIEHEIYWPYTYRRERVRMCGVGSKAGHFWLAGDPNPKPIETTGRPR